MATLLAVKGLRTEFSTPRGVIRAVDGVDLEIGEGEVVGLVGESGCGKTVTALSILYLVPDPPGRITSGEIWFRGINLLAGTEREAYVRRDWRGRPRLVRREALIRRHRARMSRIRGRGISMVFQEPTASLNPVLPIGYQIAEVLLFQRRREICEALLARRGLAEEDLELFRRAMATPEAHERERLLTDFWLRTGLPVDGTAAVVERPGVPPEERLKQVRRLARRSRLRHRWFLELVARVDVLEDELVGREWRRLSGREVASDRAHLLRLKAEYRSRRTLLRLLTATPILRRYLMRPIEEEARRRVLGLLKRVRIPEAHKVFHAYPHELSGGMQQRAMIAMALAGGPDLMIADEPTTALDVTTQAQILGLLRELRSRRSSILYITHDLAVVAEICDRVAVMYAGKIVEEAPVAALFARPLHPYTQGLLEAILSLDKPAAPGTALPSIPGAVPDLLRPPAGCRFHPRCRYAMERCRREEPRLLPQGDGRKVACFLYEEEGDAGGA